jgi:hypothetical protein
VTLICTARVCESARVLEARVAFAARVVGRAVVGAIVTNVGDAIIVVLACVAARTPVKSTSALVTIRVPTAPSSGQRSEWACDAADKNATTNNRLSKLPEKLSACFSCWRRVDNVMMGSMAVFHIVSSFISVEPLHLRSLFGLDGHRVFFERRETSRELLVTVIRQVSRFGEVGIRTNHVGKGVRRELDGGVRTERESGLRKLMDIGG